MNLEEFYFKLLMYNTLLKYIGINYDDNYLLFVYLKI